MKTLMLTSTLLLATVSVMAKPAPCRMDDYYCQSKNKPTIPHASVSKSKTLSDKIVPTQEKSAPRVEAMSESTGQGIYSGMIK